MIDGFPKDTSQAVAFEQFIGPPTTVIYIDVPGSVMNYRLKERNNFDDTQESIHKRIEVFNNSTMPLVRKWNAITINGNQKTTEVFEDIKTTLKAERVEKVENFAKGLKLWEFELNVELK